jgi:ankyrin repeat protein
MMVACERGDAKMVRMLVTLGADVNAVNEFRQPPLLYATRAGAVEMVSLLLRSGADPNIKMSDGDFVLREAAGKGISARITRALLKHGANPRAANNNGGTALHMAAFQDRSDVAKLLLRAGADANHRDRHGHGPLTCAVLRNHTDVVLLLLENGAEPEKQPEALGVAAAEGRLKLVRTLIDRGWDVNSQAHQKRSPLRHAQNFRHKAIAEALRKAGARSES